MTGNTHGRRPSSTVATIMAASAAMIVAAATAAPMARAQDAAQATQPDSGASTPPPSLTLFNQVQTMQSQLQQMQGQIEVLQHQLQQAKQADKARSDALAARIDQLERGASPAAAGSAATPPASGASAAGTAAPAPAASAAPMSEADKAAAHADYAAAFKSLRDGNFVESARGFRAFIDKYPASPLVANAYYWLGGSYYVTQNYKIALDAYQTMLHRFPDNERVPEARLRIAECQIGLKDYAAARATLQALIQSHPGASLEKRAKDKLLEIPAAGGAQ